jgi:hypothetical protein
LLFNFTKLFLSGASPTQQPTRFFQCCRLDCPAIEYDPEAVQQVISNQLSEYTLRGMGAQEKPMVGRYILAFAMRFERRRGVTALHSRGEGANDLM